LFSAFNRLLVRLGAAVTREREFADNAAHELRTPLAALKTGAQIVARDAKADRKGQVDALVQATDRATSVIDQLLQLNRVDSNIATTSVDLSAITADMCRLLAPAAIARGHDFGADIAPAIHVAGQADALAMLLPNLVDNAVRYTPEGGRIDIRLARSAAGNAELTIDDSGPGIAQDQMAIVFDRFQRLSRDEPGSGLGLAIVRRIIDRHHGSISFDNRTEGGLRITVTLPGEQRL
jgi:signal transduction histidine kinase